MSRERRREMVDREHPALSTVRQCALLGISRSSVYYRTPAEVFNGESLQLDEQSMERRWLPSRALVDLAKTAGPSLNIAPMLSN